MVLSIPSTDDLPTLQQVREKIKDAAGTKGTSFAFAKSNVLSFLDNARAVIGKERAEVHVKAGVKGLELSVKTVNGQVKNQVKGKGKGEFKIDYEYFLEVVAKAAEELEFTVVSQAFISAKLSDSTTIVALNQE